MQNIHISAWNVSPKWFYDQNRTSSRVYMKRIFVFLTYLKVWAPMFSTFSASIQIQAQKYVKYPNFSLECVSQMILWLKPYFVKSLRKVNFPFLAILMVWAQGIHFPLFQSLRMLKPVIFLLVHLLLKDKTYHLENPRKLFQ